MSSSKQIGGIIALIASAIASLKAGHKYADYKAAKEKKRMKRELESVEAEILKEKSK